MIDIKRVIYQINTTKTTGAPVLFENTKRSFLLLGRMLRNLQTQKKFTYSTVVKMMSSRRRASKEEMVQWLDMLVAENILLQVTTPDSASHRPTSYYMFTSLAYSLRQAGLFEGLMID